MTKLYKIFVSVGTRFPMNRLISAVDTFVGENSNYSCIAQIGDSQNLYKNIKTHDFLKESEFKNIAQTADIHISHAGMGNILMSSELQKPIIIVPRKALYDEHINDHQVDTAHAFSYMTSLYVVDEISELPNTIKNLDLNCKQITNKEPLAELNIAINNFINA